MLFSLPALRRLLLPRIVRQGTVSVISLKGYAQTTRIDDFELTEDRRPRDPAFRLVYFTNTGMAAAGLRVAAACRAVGAHPGGTRHSDEPVLWRARAHVSASNWETYFSEPNR